MCHPGKGGSRAMKARRAREAKQGKGRVGRRRWNILLAQLEEATNLDWILISYETDQALSFTFEYLWTKEIYDLLFWTQAYCRLQTIIDQQFPAPWIILFNNALALNHDPLHVIYRGPSHLPKLFSWWANSPFLVQGIQNWWGSLVFLRQGRAKWRMYFIGWSGRGKEENFSQQNFYEKQLARKCLFCCK